MKRTFFIFFILEISLQAYSQSNKQVDDSLFMIRAAKHADSIFMILYGKYPDSSSQINSTIWIYDGQGNVIDGSKLKLKQKGQIVLKDTLTNHFFVLDSTHITIKAFDQKNNLLWTTDPLKDNKIPSYRNSRPIIIQYEIGKRPKDFQKKIIDNRFVIWITYDNTQFGYIELDSGKFHFCGQD